jgi:hypothetical protein
MQTAGINSVITRLAFKLDLAARLFGETWQKIIRDDLDRPLDAYDVGLGLKLGDRLSENVSSVGLREDALLNERFDQGHKDGSVCKSQFKSASIADHISLLPVEDYCTSGGPDTLSK